MQHTNLKDYIVVLENIIPDELCAEIIAEYSSAENWEAATTSGGLNLSVRNVDSIGISQAGILTENVEGRKKLDLKVFDGVSIAIKKYADMFPHCHIAKDSGYDLLRYNAGQFYTEHTDSSVENPRAVSCSIALNDDFDGGEFGFFGREVVIKAPKGGAVLFPSNFMYPHEILPVTKGTRYSVITWLI